MSTSDSVLSIAHLTKLLGVETSSEKYSYAHDERFGVTAKEKIPETWVKTTCGYCSVGCGMLIGVRDGNAVGVRGDPDHPVNDGKLCPKGLCEHETITADGRALYPLRKTWTGFQRTSWGDAYSLFAEQVRSIQSRYGNDSFAILSTGQLVTEEFYTLGKLAQLGIRTRNYDGNTTLCMASAVSGYKRSFGSDGPPGSYEDLDSADTVVLIGANIADNHPILAYRLFRNKDRENGCKVVVVDPRATKTAMQADYFLPIRPRTDVYLLNGLAKVLVDEGWVDEAWIRDHANGFDELVEHLKGYELSHVAKLCRLSEGQIYEVARRIGTSKSTLFAWTMGVNHSTQGTETVNLINNLALLTRNVGVEGGAPLSITGQCNAMGTRETGFTSSLPGYRKFESEGDRQELANLWGIDGSEIPTKRGLAYPDIIDAIADGKIKGLWVIGTNPLVSFPNQARLRSAIEKLDFLVVQDGFHPTPTTELADLVLPAAIWGEKEGSYTNSERRVSKVNAAVEPPGEAKSDFRIFLDLAREFDVDRKLFPSWREPKDAFDEWRKVSEGRLCDYSGMTYERLAEGPLQWPANSSNPEGSERLYEDGTFPTDDGRAQLFR
ncbi:MAG: molybdopterin-dependent oxidoreductase, partial [Planctomycetota bacterium]